MDDRKLEVLLAAVRTGSFSKASEELNCTQSAVTQTINSLENELNLKLLERSHRGIKLTESGEQLYPYIVDTERSLRQLKEQSERISSGKTIPLRIGSFSSISSTWLPKRIQEYQKKHPDISFDLRIGTDDLAELLLVGEIDLVIGDRMRLHAFRWYPLMDDPYYAVLPVGTTKASSITQTELASYPFIMAPLNALERYLSVIPKDRLSISCDNDATLISMVSQGLGVTAIPKLCLEFDHPPVDILELTPPVKREIGIALPNTPTREAQSFTKYLRDYFLNHSPKHNNIN